MADGAEIQKTPEELAAEKQAEVDRKTRENAELAQAISKGVVEGLAQRSAAERAQQQSTQTTEPAIEDVDPAEIDRRIKAGEPIADLIAKFGSGVAERTRRAVMAETGNAVSGLQEVVLNTARKEIEHFSEYEAEILEIIGRVSPAKRTLKTYQDASAMVLGRPEIRKKLMDAEIAKLQTKPKEGVGNAETGGASRMVKSGSAALEDGDLAPTEENLRSLVGEDALQAFLEKKRQRGATLDSEAKAQGYFDAKAWFKRMRENDERSAAEGFGADVNWVRGPNGTWIKDEPWVTGVSR